MTIPASNEIVQFMHCGLCIDSMPNGYSPRDWAALEVGWTALGFQVWCKRHGCNVIHVNFEGSKHPANVNYDVKVGVVWPPPPPSEHTPKLSVLNAKLLKVLLPTLDEETANYIGEAIEKYDTLRAENEKLIKVIEDRGHAFQEAQNRTLIKNEKLREWLKKIAEAGLTITTNQVPYPLRVSVQFLRDMANEALSVKEGEAR